MSSDVGQYALQAGAAGLTMTPPVGHQIRDRHVVWVINKLEDKVPTIAGLPAAATAVVGTGAQAVDNGPQRITVFEFDELAGLGNTAVVVTGAINCLGGGYVVRPAADEVFKPCTVLFASDTTSGTGFAAVMPSNQGFQLNDWCIQIGTFTHGNPGLPGRSVTIPGCTLTGAGGIPLNSAPQNALGNHQYTFTDRGQVTAGAQTSAGTAGATTTTATTGGAAHIRLSVWKTPPVGQAAETDAAQPVGRRKLRAALTALETDAAQAVSRRKARAVGTAGETDSALVVARRKIRALGTAVEVSAAQVVGRWKTYLLGAAFESDEARPVGRRKSLPVGTAGEVDTALPITRPDVPAGPSLEVDLSVTVEPDRFTAMMEPDRWTLTVEPDRYSTEVES